MLYIKIVKRVNPENSHWKFFFSFSLILYLNDIGKSSHYSVYLKLTQWCMSVISQTYTVIYVNYISINLEEIKNRIKHGILSIKNIKDLLLLVRHQDRDWEQRKRWVGKA